MNKYIIGSVLLVSSFVPVFSFAQNADINPSDAPECADIIANLGYTSRDSVANGNGVSILQDFLNSNNYLTSLPSGYFGRLTLTAVKAFQIANGISGTGYVGAITRAKIKNIDCNGGVLGTSPSISTVVTTPAPVVNTQIQTVSDTATSCSTQGTIMFGQSGQGYIGCDIVANGTFNLANSYCVGEKTGRKQSALMKDVYGRTNYYWNTLTGLDTTEQVDVFINSNGRNIQCLPSLNVQTQITNNTAIITRVYPSQAEVNVPISIYGSNLTAATRVSFYNLSGTYLGDLPVIYWSSSQMQFTVPTDFKWGAGNYQINLTSPGSEAALNTNKVAFTITAPKNIPTISYVTPAAGSGGETIILYGTNLNSDSVIKFSRNGTVLASLYGSNIQAATGNQLSFKLDGRLVANSDSGVYQLSITNSQGTSNSINFTFLASATDTATACVTQGSNTYPGGIAADQNGLIGCDIVANGSFDMSRSFCQGQISTNIKRFLQPDDYGRTNYYYTTLTSLTSFEHVNVFISSNGNLIQCTPKI